MHAKGNLLYWSKPLCVEIVHIPLIPDPASTASIFSFVRPSLVNTFSFARDDISCMSSIRGKGYFSRFAMHSTCRQHSRILPYASPLAIREPRHRRGSNMPAASNRKAYTRFEKQWPGMSVLVNLDVNSFGETHAMQLLLRPMPCSSSLDPCHAAPP